MLRIRLQRPGKSIKGIHHYKIVVMEGSAARDSKFNAQVGIYNPARKILNIDIAKYQEWVKKGAAPTEAVAALFKRYKKESQAKEQGD
jgi:small subunit ribosomal protein S16